MLDNLTQRLAKVVKTMRGEARLTETNTAEMLREVRLALLEADVALPAVREFIAKVKEKALGEEVISSLTPGQALVGVVQRELAALMGADLGPTATQLNFATQPPAIILMAGLQGVGKTTTVGKLAKFLRDNHKKKVLTVSADVYRPAAIAQLKSVTEQVGADFFPTQTTDKPVEIALAALDFAKKHYHDVLIIDTAGRLGVDEAMMQEIKAVHAAVHPIETLFVVDAMVGQDAVNSARAFNEALPLTGIVLTKLDGDSRGGAALSVRHITGVPIKFSGVSEKMDGLEAFDAARMANRILGMGDVVSLVERAQQQFDEKEAAELQKKIRKNKFDFNDFYSQIQQIKKMGNMKDLMGMIPGVGKMMKNVEVDDNAFKTIEAIIQSMTPFEKENPDSINQSRRNRIAKGAGTDLTEVNRLIKQFDDMRKVMKQMSNPAAMASMMRRMPKM